GRRGLHGRGHRGAARDAGEGDRDRPRRADRRRQRFPHPMSASQDPPQIPTRQAGKAALMSAETPAPAASTPPKAAKVIVPAEDLRALVSGVFAARGASAADAATIAEALVWANLRGIDSHGVARVPRYLELFDKGESRADAVPTVKRPRAAI